jgi:hypothetical protein
MAAKLHFECQFEGKRSKLAVWRGGAAKGNLHDGEDESWRCE